VLADPVDENTVANAEAQMAALCSILDEWSSGSDSATRMSNIANGGGLNGANVFDASTVFGDGDRDYLRGGRGFDWAFVDDADRTSGISTRRGDVVTEL